MGHTPTAFLTGRMDEDFRIWHGEGILDLDCGCGSRNNPHRRLACLRLEDLAEFYVGPSAFPGESAGLPPGAS